MEIYPIKGLFRPDEEVVLRVCGADSCSGEIQVFRLSAPVCTVRFETADGCCEISIGCLAAAGYGVVFAADSGEVCTCAFDVQSGREIFRYGFLSDFLPDGRGDSDILSMAKHHVNAVQFYDWSFRHHSLVADAEEYTDMMGKRNSGAVIREKIGQCHERGMLALGYGAVYASAEQFAAEHPEWRLYGRKDKPIRFIDVFAIMNLRSGWGRHIIGQYSEAVRFGFDGIHMDTYGFPKTALDIEGNVIHLEEDFPELIRNTRKELPEAVLVFNNVGAWPVEDTMTEAVDAVYIEVWPPYSTYYHLKELINKAKTAGKPVVMAAYPAAFRTDTPVRALNSEIMLLCAINAHGATQLWFGEENAAITQGYYADYTKLTVEQELTLRRIEDFFVRYEEVFFDPELTDVSMTHFGWDNTEYRFSGGVSAAAEAGKPWAIIRERPGRKLITVINLTGDRGTEWSLGRENAETLYDLSVTIEVPEKIKSVKWASPDANRGALTDCLYCLKDGAKCPEIGLAIPEVQSIAFVLVETEENI